jgi:two-component system LytT family sensor kinase
MQQHRYNIRRDRKGWITIAMHVLIWLIVFLIPYIFSADMQNNSHHKNKNESEFLYLNTGLNIFWVVLFYFNAGLLLPKLIYRRKTGLYILALIVCFSMMVLLDMILFHLLISSHVFSLFNSVKHNFIPFVFTLAVSAAYKAVIDKTKADILMREKQSEYFKTELSFLRSQISPHFLFNVLNNITALARLKSDELEPTVMKLSSLMRYMLYETDEDKVILKNEVEYLQDYIDLQKQRYGDELTLQVLFHIKEEWQTIEPMLLIPFVENAFKHGNVLQQNPHISIHLQVADNQLYFTVKNKFESNKATKDKTSGIGLVNVKRRLELLYPGKHTLSIQKKDDLFIVSLQLILK